MAIYIEVVRCSNPLCFTKVFFIKKEVSCTVVLPIKAGSHYTVNLLQPATDSCEIENFLIFRSNLQCDQTGQSFALWANF